MARGRGLLYRFGTHTVERRVTLADVDPRTLLAHLDALREVPDSELEAHLDRLIAVVADDKAIEEAKEYVADLERQVGGTGATGGPTFLDLNGGSGYSSWSDSERGIP